MVGQSYAVLPDCSFDLEDFDSALTSTTFVAAHELIESVTDTYPTPGNSPAYPQAQNTTDGNEIADLCQGSSATLKGSKADYKISQEWSNSRNSCYSGA